ncbi:unnamed protein product [Rotaria socialis]|uniref:Major facilitator superfamily (MFS) profile domain-containing protein n=1 Tax=Rotaria socialis TaxID=392032 RepID=A0A818YMJ3_9BILA|nr:unnamed protein product [Rotaria socialis]CAF4613094.1 unnamed protein product [Rotaria socialis]
MSSNKDFQVYLTGGFAAIGGLLFGYDTGVISGVLTMSDFLLAFGGPAAVIRGSLPSSISGSIVGIMLVGCFLGALLAGPAGDRFSRKYSIVIFSLVFIVSAILQTGSFNLFMLLLSRFVAGISVGALSMLVPVYQSEIATKNIRGRLISLQQWAITIGIAISFWINYGTNVWFFGTSAAWRIPLALQIVPALTLAVGILFFPFSPRWLMAVGRDSEALRVLSQIRSVSSIECLDEYNDIKNEIDLEREQAVRSYAQFFYPPLRRRLILGVSIQILQQLTGINSVMYYAPEIFKQAGLNDQGASLLATGINGFVLIIATIPAILYIDKLGRRFILISGALLMTLSMLIMGGTMGVHGYTHFNETLDTVQVIIPNQTASYVIIFFVYVFVASFAFSWGPTAWVYCTEIFPLSMRSKGTSITTAANWATNCIVSFLVPALLESLTYGTYLIFGIFCIIMGTIIYLFYPETNGKSLEDMDLVFGQSILAVKPCGEKVKPRMKSKEKHGIHTNQVFSHNEPVQIYRF